VRPVQYFSPEYLERCRELTPEQVVAFLDDFQALHAAATVPRKSRLISLRLPEPLLAAFRARASLAGVPYQTQIKRLMSAWLESPDAPAPHPARSRSAR
jgi:predicted DNA binding CopG/RHH family protein